MAAPQKIPSLPLVIHADFEIPAHSHIINDGAGHPKQVFLLGERNHIGTFFAE
jgi:hypothetical protein